MVAIKFDMAAYQFDQGIRAIELMWVAGIQVLDQQSKETMQNFVEFQFLEEKGELPEAAIVNDDESVSEADQLRLEISALGEARDELNNAAVISLYHVWERSIPAKSATTIRTSKDLLSDAEKAGIQLHHEIGALVSCANYLKHGNPKRLTELKNNFPTKFPGLKGDESDPAWMRRLRISDDHLRWMFGIVRHSKRPILESP